MDIKVLEYFLAVAREENITKAAESLHMTQPPLSRQLKELEDEIGKQLFIRGSKKITLTVEGHLLCKRAEELVSLMNKIKLELSSNEEIGGDVFIGSGESDAFKMIAKTIKTIQKDHPSIKYHIYSGDANLVTDKLDRGLVDFGLLVEPFDISKYDYIRLPVKDIWGVLMPKSSPLANKETITPEDLWDKPLIISHQSYVSDEMLSWLAKDKSQLNIVATYDLLYNATHLVKEGVGYTIALDKLITITGESNICFKPLSPLSEAGLCIVWKKYQVFSRASEIFLKEIKKEYGAKPNSK